MTDTEQIPAVGSAELQVLLAENSEALAPLTNTPKICKAPPPEFRSVTDFGALVVPLEVLEKLRDDGEIDSFGALCASAGRTKPVNSKTDSRTTVRTDHRTNVAGLLHSIKDSKE